MESLRRKFGRGVVPLQIPVGEEKSFKGTVDLVGWSPTSTRGDSASDGPIPEDLAARAAEEHEKLVEMVAEGDDDAHGEVLRAGHARSGRHPAGAPEGNRRAQDLPRSSARRRPRRSACGAILDACATLLPSPEGTKVTGVGKDGKPVEVVTDEKEHAVAQVFKTVSDPFAGRISYMRVRSGHFPVRRDLLERDSKGVPERFSGLFLPQGKEHVNVPEAQAPATSSP